MAYHCTRFTWDEAKDALNRRKHGLSFDEARELFASDVRSIEIFDARNSVTEDRFISIGPIGRGPVLVAWTELDDGVVRIISARRATRREASRYRKLNGDER
ncbi:MAG: BrnT family toxin [Planctomycetota bacterium]